MLRNVNFNPKIPEPLLYEISRMLSLNTCSTCDISPTSKALATTSFCVEEPPDHLYSTLEFWNVVFMLRAGASYKFGPLKQGGL